MTKNVILAITGASGAVYAVRLLQVVLAAGHDVHLSISSSGKVVIKQELDVDVDLDHFDPAVFSPAALRENRGAELLASVMADLPGTGDAPTGKVHYHHYQNYMAPIASGSFLSGGMVICPCSGATMSAIAHAGATNLIQRAAEVQLKERRPLVLVPRETPLSENQIENMQRASRAGAIVLPAMPGWYHGVREVRDLVDFVVARICDQLAIENALIRRWGSE